MNYVNFTAVCGFSVSKLILYWSNTVLTRWHHLNIQVPFITFALIFSKYCIMKVFKLHIGPSNSTFEIFFFFFLQILCLIGEDLLYPIYYWSRCHWANNDLLKTKILIIPEF